MQGWCLRRIVINLCSSSKTLGFSISKIKFSLIFFFSMQETALWWVCRFRVSKLWELLKYGETWISAHIFINVRPTRVIKYRCNWSLDVSQVDKQHSVVCLYMLEIVSGFSYSLVEHGPKRMPSIILICFFSLDMCFIQWWRVLCLIPIRFN